VVHNNFTVNDKGSINSNKNECNALVDIFTQEIECLSAAMKSKFHNYKSVVSSIDENIAMDAMKFKLNTDTIDSLTNLFIFFLKTLEFKEVSADPNRIPLMPHFEDANLLDFVERYIQSGSNSEFVVTMNGLFKECIMPSTVKSSLLHYQTNLAFKIKYSFHYELFQDGTTYMLVSVAIITCNFMLIYCIDSSKCIRS
jgi:hypothetical protein